MLITLVQCMPKQQVEDATMVVQPGSSVVIVYSQTNDHCSNSSDDTYILLHEDHRTGVLREISQQQNYTFQISAIQLNTSGVYCVYKQCASEHREQCCIRITGIVFFGCGSYSYIYVIVFLFLKFHQICS